MNGRADVRPQLPFAADDTSLPEPDLAVVSAQRPVSGHPAEAFLLIEVADSSLPFDRTTKAALYADAGAPEYWIVNLADRSIEVHTDPANGAYTRHAIFREDDTIPPRAFPDVAIEVGIVVG